MLNTEADGISLGAIFKYSGHHRSYELILAELSGILINTILGNELSNKAISLGGSITYVYEIFQMKRKGM